MNIDLEKELIPSGQTPSVREARKRFFESLNRIDMESEYNSWPQWFKDDFDKAVRKAQEKFIFSKLKL